jgi:signal transduction histidine kinase
MFRIEVILANLISNAIKYQKNEVQNKKVGINVKVKKEEAEINIVDNGIGILNEHLDKIFNQFFKVNTHQGTGLGLFIVKEALEKINGKISVFSNINQGTTFKIIIPNANL